MGQKLDDLRWNLWIWFCDKPKILYYKLKHFFKNLWVFRKTMWEFRDWDHAYCVKLYRDGLLQLVKTLENGNEERYSTNKKISKIKELIKLLDHYDSIEEFYNTKESLAEKKYQDDVLAILKGVDTIELNHRANEFMLKLQQDDNKKKDFCDKYNINPKSICELQYYAWVEVFDGSNCRTWWD